MFFVPGFLYFDYFSEIDTEEKAYWLGFLYADGSIDKRGVLRVELISEGKQHLEKFAKAIKYTGSVIGPYFRNKIKNPIYKIDLSNPRFGKDLQNKGVIQNKTFFVQFPKWLKTELVRHFIRGIFDGDGTITCKLTKYNS